MKPHPKNLKKLLRFYDQFCKIERHRIIEANKKYGDDWQKKDNRFEYWMEVLDEWGYRGLAYAQKMKKLSKK